MKKARGRRRGGRPPRLSRRVARELRPHWWRVTLTLFVDLLSTPVILLTPIPLKIVVDSVLHDYPLPGFLSGLPLTSSHNGVLWLAAIIQVLVVVFAELQAMASYTLSTWTGERMTLSFRARLFRHIQRLSILLHDRRGTADSVYRVQYDGTAIADITTGCLLPVATSAVASVEPSSTTITSRSGYCSARTPSRQARSVLAPL